MKQVTPDIGDTFVPVEDVLQYYLLPALFQGVGEGIPGPGVTCLPVKQVGVALPYPTNTAPENCTASCVNIGNLIAALRGREVFQTAEHATIL